MYSILFLGIYSPGLCSAHALSLAIILKYLIFIAVAIRLHQGDKYMVIVHSEKKELMHMGAITWETKYKCFFLFFFLVLICLKNIES